MGAALIILLVAFGLPAAHSSEQPQSLARDPGNERPTAVCDTANADILSGPALFERASACMNDNRPLEANFLLNAAMIRLSVDMMQTVPASSADAESLTGYAGALMFFSEGPGEAEILRDSTSRSRLFALLDAWSPRFDQAYSPGWNVRERPDLPRYEAAISEAKAARREDLTRIAQLVADDIYYALYRRVAALRSQTRTAQSGVDRASIEDLHRQMRDRARELGSPLVDVDPGPDGEPRFPRSRPAADEAIVAVSDDPVAARCRHAAEWESVARDARIVRTLITRSPEWGLIWRADIGNGGEVERFTCTSNTSSLRPLIAGDEPIPPLPGELVPSGKS